MNKTELKLQVMKMKKSSVPLNHIYDYLLVQCLLNNDGLVPESVKEIERITGIIINDVRLMVCLMFYWRALSMDKRLEKCCNITMYLVKKEMGIDPGPAEGIRDKEHEKRFKMMFDEFIKSIKSNPK